MPKTSIRGQVLALRRQLASADCLWRSLKIQETFIGLPEFADAEVLALYSPIHNEVYTEEIFHRAQALRKRVVYPCVSGDHLHLFEAHALGDLSSGSFGVLEPRRAAQVAIDAIDLVVVPGVAFDYSGHRLGYGKGFYDRLLQGRSARTTLVGLCFDFQLVPSLPAEEHDIRMDILITESGKIHIRR